MKHAYLIIAHNEYPVLKALLLMLDDERNDIYLHIDQRSTELYEKIRTFQARKAQLHVLSTRNKVYWGDLSQVETEYLLLETALAQETYSYYHLLSGTDLPIQHKITFIRSFKQIQARNLWATGQEINIRKI